MVRIFSLLFLLCGTVSGAEVINPVFWSRDYPDVYNRLRSAAVLHGVSLESMNCSPIILRARRGKCVAWFRRGGRSISFTANPEVAVGFLTPPLRGLRRQKENLRLFTLTTGRDGLEVVRIEGLGSRAPVLIARRLWPEAPPTQPLSANFRIEAVDCSLAQLKRGRGRCTLTFSTARSPSRSRRSRRSVARLEVLARPEVAWPFWFERIPLRPSRFSGLTVVHVPSGRAERDIARILAGSSRDAIVLADKIDYFR